MLFKEKKKENRCEIRWCLRKWVRPVNLHYKVKKLCVKHLDWFSYDY